MHAAVALALLPLAAVSGKAIIYLLILSIAMYYYAPTIPKAAVNMDQFCTSEPHEPKPVLRISSDPQLDNALREVINCIVKAYVLRWHDQISPFSQWFPQSLDELLSLAFSRLLNMIYHKDWPKFVVGQLVPILTSHIHSFSLADAEVKRNTAQMSRLSETDALHSRVTLVYSKYTPLHPHTNSFDAHIAAQSNKLASLVLPREILEYGPSANFACTMISNAVLKPALTLVTNPDFCNQQIVGAAENVLRDSARIYRLRKMVQLSLPGELPPISPDTDERGFEEFLQAVESIESVALARQIHYTVRLLAQRLQHNKLDARFLLYYERLMVTKSVLETLIRTLDPHSLNPDVFADFDFNSVLSSPECMALFQEFMKYQEHDYLQAFNQIGIILDTSSVDPLGGFEMETPMLEESNQQLVDGLYHLLRKTDLKLKLSAFEEFLSDPSRANYVEVQRLIWSIRANLLRKLELQMPKFKNSVYFDEYMAVAGTRKNSVDRLQTDDIEAEMNDINNEIVHEAVQDAIGGFEEDAPFEKARDFLEDIQNIVANTNNEIDFSSRIQKASDQLTSLESQMAVLAPLLQKAELTNDVAELNILRKSIDSLKREISRLELIKDQLVMKSKESSITSLEISSHCQDSDSGGEYTCYIITAENATDQWQVQRRYRQFYSLHKILRRKFPQVEGYGFPKKKMVLKFQQRQFVESRQVALNTYLKNILQVNEIANHISLRMFLTSESFPHSYYDYVPLDKAATPQEDEDEDKSFLQPVCDLFLTMFNIGEDGSDWLRSKAIVIVAQQILGGTIEKRIRDIGQSIPAKVPEWINKATGTIWPDLPRVPVQRTLAERIHARDHAKLLLQKITKFWLGRVVGLSNCNFASDTTHGFLQNSTLNRHLMLSLFDEIVEFLICPASSEDVLSPQNTPIL